MRFTKMHGAGNDYVFLDGFNGPVPPDPAALARRLSDRHRGVGGDGLILILPSRIADLRMRIFNADGSEAEMCGNGLRCAARYAFEHGLCRRERIAVETGRGVLATVLEIRDGLVQTVGTNMGPPIVEAAAIPTTLPGDPPLNVPLTVEGTVHEVGCVSMGNPHCVLFVEDHTDPVVHGLGPRIERHPAFPDRVNVEFVVVRGPGELSVRVWERGSGETLACGTGACAAAVIGALTGRTGRCVDVTLPGGRLRVDWRPDGELFLTGPAEEVFTGEWAA